jgi:menaquinone-dependent protoporphyrinogen IX oxidase
MNEHVMVGYVTKTGTTKRLSEALARGLGRHGFEARAVDLSSGPDLSEYSHLVFGAPINGMQLVPGLMEFLESRTDLGKRTLAVFAVSYIYGHGRRMWRRAIEKSLGKAVRLCSAQESTVFGGAVDSEFPGFARFLFGLPRGLPLDTVDENAAESWADTLAPHIRGKDAP